MVVVVVDGVVVVVVVDRVKAAQRASWTHWPFGDRTRPCLQAHLGEQTHPKVLASKVNKLVQVFGHGAQAT